MTLTPEYLAELEAAIARHDSPDLICDSQLDKDHIRFAEAARTFHAIAPFLMEVIEARGRSTEGEWWTQSTGAHWNNPALENLQINWSKDGEAVCDTVYERSNADFITTAANNITKIEKVLRDAPKESDDERA